MDDAYDNGSTTASTESPVSTEDSTERTISAYFVLFSALLSLVLILSRLLHDRPVLSRILPEAGMILIVGIVFGAIIHLFVNEPLEEELAEGDEDSSNETVAQSLLSFSPEVFFLVLLPPIIFNSGYHLRKELFFRHITPICLFAVIGTTISALFIAFFMEYICNHDGNLCGDFQPMFTELLTFGALISATDPVSTLAVFSTKRVDPQLFYLVFGESVLNDAVGLVLFNAFSKFVVRDNGAGKVAIGISEFIVGFLYDSVVSPVLGLVLGVFAALIFKWVDMRRTKLLELSLYVLIMYVPFLVAEMLDLSGIVTILVTGMTAKNYVVPNLSEVTADNADTFFRLAAHLAETSIFLELGLSISGLLSPQKSSMQNTVYFILWSLLACLIGRALNIYPIAFLFNRRLRRTEGDDLESTGSSSPTGGGKYHHHHRLNGHEIVASNSNSSHPDDHNGQMELPRRSTSTNGGSSSNNNNHQQEEQPQDGSIDTRSNHGPTIIGPSLSGSPPQLSQSGSGGSRHSTSSSPPPDIQRNDSQVSAQSMTPRVRRDLRISANTMHMLWFSGLRGAVAYACVRSFPDTFGHANEFTITTMVIVLVTVFCLGSTTECALNLLHIEQGVDEGAYMENWHRERQQDGLILKFENLIRDYAVRSSALSSSHNIVSNGSGSGGGPMGMGVDITDDQQPPISSAAATAAMAASSHAAAIAAADGLHRTTPDDQQGYHHHVEMTESEHFDTMDRLGYSTHRGRKRESVFDYGGDSRG